MWVLKLLQRAAGPYLVAPWCVRQYGFRAGRGRAGQGRAGHGQNQISGQNPIETRSKLRTYTTSTNPRP